MPQKEKARRPRGSFPPSLTLPDAMSIVTHIYENVGGDASYDTFARVIGNSPSSSTFTRKLGALKNYGLVTEENKLVKVSGLGSSIVAPTAPHERNEALKQAFLNVDVFAALYEKYRGKLLPQDEFLINVVSSFVPKEFANTWIDRFKQSAKAAGLISDRGDGKLQVREIAETERDVSLFPAEESRSEVQQQVPVASPPTRRSEDSDSVAVPYGHVSKIKLSEGRQAEFSLPDRLTARDAQKLKGALQGLAAIIDSMVDDTEDRSKSD